MYWNLSSPRVKTGKSKVIIRHVIGLNFLPGQGLNIFKLMVEI